MSDLRCVRVDAHARMMPLVADPLRLTHGRDKVRLDVTLWTASPAPGLGTGLV